MGEPLRFALTQAEIEHACMQFAIGKHGLEGTMICTTRLRILRNEDGNPSVIAVVEARESEEEE